MRTTYSMYGLRHCGGMPLPLILFQMQTDEFNCEECEWNRIADEI